ncbi:MAG: hypothetical protein KL863_07410 [Rhizobium sp.]|nr:hypothetical protein [Rhizobium sp.]
MAFPIVELGGSREKPKGVKLTTTDPTTIMSGPVSGFLTLESLRYSCDGTPTDLSLWVTDGTTSWFLMKDYAVAANDLEPPIEDHIVLKTGWSLRAQASNANQIDILAVFIVSGQGSTA